MFPGRLRENDNSSRKKKGKRIFYLIEDSRDTALKKSPSTSCA